MLFPKFRIRTMLFVTAGASLFFFAVARATRGELWPVALVAAVAFAAAGLSIHALMFGMCWLLARTTGRGDTATARVAYPTFEHRPNVPRPAPRPAPPRPAPPAADETEV